MKSLADFLDQFGEAFFARYPASLCDKTKDDDIYTAITITFHINKGVV